MSRCSKGMVKKRHSKGAGHPGNYAHSLRGCTWKKMIQDTLHIGRQCVKCGRKVLNARGRIKEKVKTNG